MSAVAKARSNLRKAKEIHAACVSAGASAELRSRAFKDLEKAKAAVDAAVLKEYQDGVSKSDEPPAKSR